MPALARLGLLVLAVGLLFDVAYHALPSLTEPLFGSGGVRAHLVLLVGMLIVVSGLIQQGLHARFSISIPRRSPSRAHR